jgi:signal transduction histidine kinase
VIIRWDPLGIGSDGTATAARERDVHTLRRFTVEARGPVFWTVLWVMAVVLELAVLIPALTGDEVVPGFRQVFRTLGGSFLACGLIAWQRRPDSRSGLLMFLTGVCLLIEPLSVRFDSPAIQNAGEMLEDTWGIPFLALLLTINTGGRLTSRIDRLLVGGFVLQLAIELLWHLFLEQPGNFLLAFPDADVARVIEEANLVLVSTVCLAGAVVIGLRWKAASGPRRRAMLPSVAGISCLLFFAAVQQFEWLWLIWLAVLSLLLVPGAFLAGLLRSRLARGGLADLFTGLRTMTGASLQTRLAKALGDPGLLVAYPRGSNYVSAAGAPVELPDGDGGERAVARIERDGRELAAIVYDASLDDDPELLEAARTAAAVALENESLRAESEVRLAELQASRLRIVEAGDAERRRLERDLHDGAQQRLVALALRLRLVQADIRRDPEAAEALVTTASAELAESLQELRELARGLHPAVLEHGLPSALESLASRATLPTAVDCRPTRPLSRPVELGLYFVACEALTNVGKYSEAATASVRLFPTRGGVAVEIADDGRGGADAARGSGLRGLEDRVEALGGTLLVTSPPGEGTVVLAEVPCGS